MRVRSKRRGRRQCVASFFFPAPLGYGGRYILSLGVRRGGRGWRSDILEGGRGEGIGCLSEPMMVEGGREWRTLLEGGKQAWQANEYIRGRRLLSLLDCLLACIAKTQDIHRSKQACKKRVCQFSYAPFSKSSWVWLLVFYSCFRTTAA